jgi:hypothetical protein
MNNEELEKRLTGLDVPDITVVSHHLKLREALLATIAVRGLERESNFRDRFRPKWDAFSALWQRPVWRFTLSGAVALVITFSLFLGYRLTGDVSPAVLAADIALNNPDVPGMLEGTGEIRVLNIKISNGTACVICGRNIGSVVQVDIDLKSRKTLRAQRLNGLFLSELTEALKTDALKIAMADPRVKQMVSQGGNVRKVMPSLSSMSGVSQLNDDLLKILASSDKAVVQMECGGRSWLIQTNLNERLVERIIEPQRRVPAASPSNANKAS